MNPKAEIFVSLSPSGDSEKNERQCEFLQTLGAVQERLWGRQWRILARSRRLFGNEVVETLTIGSTKEMKMWICVFLTGLQNIFLITSGRKYELRVHMEDFEQGGVYAHYTTFYIDSETYKYKLHVSGFINGGAGERIDRASLWPRVDGFELFLNINNATKNMQWPFLGESLLYHNEREFATYDKDTPTGCAVSNSAGHWFNNCLQCNPNGLYKWSPPATQSTAIVWCSWKGCAYPLKTMVLKIKRAA